MMTISRCGQFLHWKLTNYYQRYYESR